MKNSSSESFLDNFLLKFLRALRREDCRRDTRQQFHSEIDVMRFWNWASFRAYLGERFWEMLGSGSSLECCQNGISQAQKLPDNSAVSAFFSNRPPTFLNDIAQSRRLKCDAARTWDSWGYPKDMWPKAEGRYIRADRQPQSKLVETQPHHIQFNLKA